MRASDLHVVAVVSNPVRYQSRYRLFREFQAHMLASGVHLVVVEHAFGERPFEVTSAANPDHVQLRGDDRSELWLKESLTRLGFRRVLERNPDAKYLAWIDSDITFVRPDWALETIHALQHHAVVQPWEHAVDLGPSGSVMTNEWGNDVDRAFCAAYQAGQFEVRSSTASGAMECTPSEAYVHSAVGCGSRDENGCDTRSPYERASAAVRPRRDANDWRSHYGYAWAIRREVYDRIGGLINWLVTGSADYHMALGFAGMIPRTMAKHEYMATAGYRRRMMAFHDLCERHVQRNIGFVPGTILHGFHGYKKDRQYISRQQIILASKFDPDIDLVEDAQGVPVLNGENWALRDGLRGMFRARNEDIGEVRS